MERLDELRAVFDVRAALSTEAIGRLQMAEYAADGIIDRVVADLHTKYLAEHDLPPSELRVLAKGPTSEEWSQLTANRRPYVSFEDYCARGEPAIQMAEARMQAAEWVLAAIARELTQLPPSELWAQMGREFEIIAHSYRLTGPQKNVVWQELWVYPGVLRNHPTPIEKVAITGQLQVASDFPGQQIGVELPQELMRQPTVHSVGPRLIADRGEKGDDRVTRVEVKAILAEVAHPGQERQVDKSRQPGIRIKHSSSRLGGRLNPNPAYPNRAAWLQARLLERGWGKSDAYRHRGPDRKTVEKMLRGEAVRNDVLEKLAGALSHKTGKVSTSDIPED